MLMHAYGVVDRLLGKNKEAWKKGRIRGTAVLVKQKVLDLGDYHAALFNGFSELLGRENGVAFRLVSATEPDPNDGRRGKEGNVAHMDTHETTLKSTATGEGVFRVAFEWDAWQGIPGAVKVKNSNRSEFFLKTLTLEGVPGAAMGTVVFVANSWIYPGADRVFFANDTYLPSKMPKLLSPYRQEELNNLRGSDSDGTYKEHDRVYRYDVYNDLGSARPVLGGNQEYPYPRRGRTGRPLLENHPTSESRLRLLDINIYVPRDERFGHLKLSDFLGFSLKAVTEAFLPIIRTYVDDTPKEFDSFEDIKKLYDGPIKVHDHPALAQMMENIPPILKALLPVAGDDLLKMPLPHVIESDEFAWRTDEEFAREMLAGVNPVCIRRLKEFPAKSTLNPSVYGDHTSTITEADIQHNLEGLTVKMALESNRLFILDHHDNFIPYLARINELPGNYIYASRTLLFLKGDGTLKPLAIELSRDGESTVYKPAHTGVLGQIWQLAKAYACVNDSAWHQLISHWLNTHAVIEPFVIATNRQLSVVHPVHKLLSPHYRDTMNINALARQTLINEGGIFELTVFPGKYALEMSSSVYKNWKLTEQALPDDLIKR
jgi:linoleate 9S-lipoxygenase